MKKGLSGVADGAVLREQRKLGGALSVAQYAALATAASAAIATGVMALFVDWEGPRELDEAVR